MKFGWREIWLMRLFTRPKRRIMQGPSVVACEYLQFTFIEIDSLFWQLIVPLIVQFFHKFT